MWVLFIVARLINFLLRTIISFKLRIYNPKIQLANNITRIECENYAEYFIQFLC